MIELQIDMEEKLREIENALGDLKDQSPGALRNALNNSARHVRRQIVKTAQDEYALTDKALLQVGKAMKMRNAKEGDLTVQLRAKGGMNDIMKFTVSPAAPFSAKVLASGSMQGLNRGTFVAKFRSGHIAMVQRVPGETYRSSAALQARSALGLDTTRIKKLLSPAVPHMLHNEEVREQAAILFSEELPVAITRQIARILKKAGRA